MKAFVLSAAIFLSISEVATAQCLLYPVSLQSRAEQSLLIVEGKVLSQQSRWDAAHAMIYTAVEVEVYKVFKGSLAEETVHIVVEGGQVDDVMIVTNPGIQFKAGVAGIFFLHAAGTAPASALPGQNSFELFAAAQGFIRYDVSTGIAAAPFDLYEQIVGELYPKIIQYTGSFEERKPADFLNIEHGQSLTPPVISSFSPSSTYAGTQAANLFTITGSGFGSSYVSGTSKLEFKNSNDGGATYMAVPDNHIQSWSSTSITAWIPTGAGTGKFKVTNDLGEPGTSATSVTINYNESNVVSSGTYYLPDLVNDNSSGGYTYAYNTTFNSNTSAVAAFERALETWRCNTYANFTRSGTTAIAANASDGVNVITFDGASPLSSGVLGTAYSYYSSCATGVWYLTESDLKLRTDGTDGISWNFGPGSTTSGFTDFETVCLHELGHAHQLGHTNNSPVTVMHYALSTGTDRRTLTSTSEVDGGEDVMSRSTVSNSCGPTAMTALTSGTCAFAVAPVADFSASATTICKNAKISFTDLSTNSPTSWSWTFTGATPSSSTLQNPTNIKYKTVGTYAVTLIATNSAGSDTETKTSYITVLALPTASITAGGPTTFCDPGSVLLSATTGMGLTYQWKKGSANISGATLSTYMADATATYKVVITNASSCSATSSGISVTENPKPAATITPDGPTTFCPGDSVILTANSGIGYTYQWKKGSASISGATDISYTAKTSGTYKVVVTSAAGCSKTSSGVVVTAVCKQGDDLLADMPFTVYPNPSENIFIVESGNRSAESFSVKMYDVTGRMIRRFDHVTSGTEFATGDDVPAGIYFIELTEAGKSELVKWVKAK